jgi:hypothetical protein
MCDPISIGIGLAVATTAVGVVGQIQSANATNASIRAQAVVKNKEIDQAATQEISDRLRQARREQGRIMVAAGESGLNTSSPVVEGLLQDAQMQAALADQTSNANRESRKRATVAEANTDMVSKPTALGAGLQIAIAGAAAAQKGGAFKKGG